MTHGEGVVPTSAVVAVGEYPEHLAARTGSRQVKVVQVAPQLLEARVERHAAVADHIHAGGQRLRVEDILLQFGIGAQAHRTGIARTDHAVGGTQRITRGHERQTGVETLGEGLVDAVGRRGMSLTGPRQIIVGLLQVAEDLLEDHVTARLRDIDVVADRLRAEGHVTPGADQVVVHHGTQRQRLAQQIGHVGVVLDVAVLPQVLDVEVRTLDGRVVGRIGVRAAARGVHLAVGRQQVVAVDGLTVGVVRLIGLVAPVVAPLDVGVQTHVGMVTATVVRLLKQSLRDTEVAPFGQLVVREDRLGVERRLGFRFQQIGAGTERSCSRQNEYIFECFHTMM